MKASVVDLRYKMNDVLKALDRNEDVLVLYHGKVKGRLTACSDTVSGKTADYPFFGLLSSADEPVSDIMSRLRKRRYNDI